MRIAIFGRRAPSWATGRLEWALLLLLTGVLSGRASDQPAGSEPIGYQLLQGSELVIECPICALAPITLPLQGTFQLVAVEFTPGFALYAVTNLDFQAGGATGLQYRLVGSGTFQAPGLPTFGQAMLLNTQVSHDSNQVEAVFTNAVPTVSASMPVIQINLDQTNGTASSEFHLKLLAAPEVRISSAQADLPSRSVWLSWTPSGLPVQVEKKVDVSGPFVSVGQATTSGSFHDIGALTNRARAFYRLQELTP